MGSSDLAGLSAFDEVLAMGSTWPFLGDPTVASGGWQRTAPGGFDHQGPDAPSAHRRPGYPLSGCVPAEPDSVSPGNIRVTSVAQRDKPPSDTGVMPPKIHHIETPVHPEASQLVCARAWRTDGVQSIEACGPNGTMLRARWHYSLCSPRHPNSLCSPRHPFLLSQAFLTQGHTGFPRPILAASQ